MNEYKKPVWKLIFFIVQAVAEVCASVYFIKDGLGAEGNSGYQSYILGSCMLLWLIISVLSIVRFSSGKKIVFIPCIGFQLFVLILGLSAAAFISGASKEAMMIWAAGVVCELAIIIIYRLFSRRYVEEDDEVNDAAEAVRYSEVTEKKDYARSVPQYVKNSRDLGSIVFDADIIYERVVNEYCISHDKTREQLDDNDRRMIREFSCTPVSYMFLWAAKRGYLSKKLLDSVNIEPLLIDGMNPPSFVAEKLEGKISVGDFSEDLHEFVREYYAPGVLFTGDASRKFEYDYYIQIRNPWKIYYCIDFSVDIYFRVEKCLDESCDYYRCRKDWDDMILKTSSVLCEKRFSEVFDQEIVFYKGSGISGSYAEKCLDEVFNMKDDLRDRICKAVIDDYIIKRYGDQAARKYMLDTTMILENLSSGKMIIPVPSGRETAWVLIFDADFDKANGIGIVVRDNEVVSVAGASEVSSPWTCDNDFRFRMKKSLRLFDAASVDALGKALREYSDGSLEQGIIIPEFSGAAIPEENRLFVPQPAAEAKNRFDIIAEKLMNEGSADRYECSPVYKSGSFVPASVSVELFKGTYKAFSGEISIW